MTACTPIYQLPYQTGSDRPCDAPDVWCDFAADVEAQLDTFDAIVDRTVDAIPMAQVRLTAPYTFDSSLISGPVPFDTVDVDTANMVDLATSPFLITLPRFGRYGASFHLTIATIPVTNSVTAVIADGTTFMAPFDTYISDTSIPIPMNGSMSFRYDGTPTDVTSGAVNLRLLFPSSPSLIVNSARFNVFWMGDLP